MIGEYPEKMAPLGCSLSGKKIIRTDSFRSALTSIGGIRRSLTEHKIFALNLYAALCQVRWIRLESKTEAHETLLTQFEAAEYLCTTLELEDPMVFYHSGNEGLVDKDVVKLAELLEFKPYTEKYEILAPINVIPRKESLAALTEALTPKPIKLAVPEEVEGVVKHQLTVKF